MRNPVMDLPMTILERSNPHYLHFWVDEFLDDRHDAQLRAEFPSDLLKIQLGDRLSTSIDLFDGSEVVEEFLSRSPVWREYRDAFASPEWLHAVLRQFKNEFVARYPRYLRPVLGGRTLNPSNLEVSIALSFSRRGFHLSPHSDDKYKVLTLIHYFPEQPGAELTGGTRFFLPSQDCSTSDLRSFTDWSRGLRKRLPFFRFAPSTEVSLTRRYENDDYLNATERDRFNELFRVGDYVEYRFNRISGFVKNNWTLHEVDLCDFPPDQFRRAALINIRLRQRWWSRVVPTIERRLSQIKKAIRHHS